MSGSSRSSDAESDSAGSVGLDEFRGELAGADFNRHLALFYRDRREQLTAVSAFVECGLRRGKRCLYLADENSPAEIRDHLAAVGIDVDDRVAAGDIEVVDATDVYLIDGFDPDRMVDTLLEETERSVDDGYDGLYVIGENTWAFDLDEVLDRVLEFEVDFDRECPAVPVTALCQYSVERFSDAAIGKALQTHEQIIYDGTLLENPYYVPPEEYLAAGTTKPNKELLLDQVRDVSQFRTDVERREQRLSVVNRVLRHNIRNDLNVILGRVEWLKEQDRIDDDIREHLDIVTAVTEDLVDLAERARHIDRTLETTGREWVDLTSQVTDVAARIERDHEGVTVSVVSEVPSLTVDSTVGVALGELLGIAATTGDDERVDLRVRVTSGAERGIARIVVESDHGVFPEVDRTAITDTVEEASRHSMGLGVWVTRWLVEQIDGQLSIPDTEAGADLREVTMTVPAVRDL